MIALKLSTRPYWATRPQVWGGGHTTETDPANWGWYIREVKEHPGVWMIGRTGVQGCCTVRQLTTGKLSVAIYDRLPETVVDNGLMGLDPVMVEYEPTPGWGLKAIETIARFV